MERLVGVSGRKDGAWRNARSSPTKRDTRGAGNGYLRGKPPHHSQLRLPQLPPHHALLYLQCEKRQAHPTRARSRQMAHARRAKLRQVASCRRGSGGEDKGLIHLGTNPLHVFAVSGGVSRGTSMRI